MSSPQSALFDWPKPYGGYPNFTPFRDHSHEIEWQKTQHTLGRPVDVNALFAVLDRIEADCEEKIAEKSKLLEQKQADNRCMVDAIEEAVDDLNKKVRARLSEEIIGRLNKIDRHDVASLSKEIIAAVDSIQDDLRRAKA